MSFTWNGETDGIARKVLICVSGPSSFGVQVAPSAHPSAVQTWAATLQKGVPCLPDFREVYSAIKRWLARLSRDSIWAARYPVPTEPNAIRAMQQFSAGHSYLIAYYGPKYIDRLQDFMSRLRRIVEGEIGATTW